MHKRVARPLIATTVCLFLMVGCGPQQFRSDLFLPFESAPSAGPTAMTHDGTDMILGTANQVIFTRNIQIKPYTVVGQRMEPANYSESGRFPLQLYGGAAICGLAWENRCCQKGFLWIVDATEEKILKFSEQRKLKAQFPSPGSAPSGMSHDGQHLWLCDQDEGVIRKIDTETGQTLQTLRSPVRHPTGIAWDCGYLWVVGSERCAGAQRGCQLPRLIRMNLGKAIGDQEIVLPDMVAQPNALTWRDGYLWVGDRASNRIFRFSTDKMVSIDPIAIDHLP
jgi:hypothetical protein